MLSHLPARFYLPNDLTDNFFYSGWKHPEKYLDEKYRSGISVLALSDKKMLSSIIKKLQSDLEAGIWDGKYGYVKNLETYNGGYLFMTIRKNN